MRFPVLLALVALCVNALIDIYIYRALRVRTSGKLWPRVQKWTAIGLFAVLLGTMFWPKGQGGEAAFASMVWVLYIYISIYIGKGVFVVFDLVSRLPRLWGSDRWRWVSLTGVLAGILVAGTMWWGALVTRYQLQVQEQQINIARLPAGLDGLRVVQISDLHVGTFGSDPKFLNKLVDRVNDLQPDVILFTGDLVNRRSDEMEPFVSALSGLRAKYGVYSVLGNHDYGDYMMWESDQAKAQNLQRLRQMQADMGWTLLDNEHRWLTHEGDSLAIIGVENVGEPPFSVYGDLDRAYPDISDDKVKILMTHNPTHWDRDLQDNPHSNIDLTLSGHTHAMQIMVLGWSPSAWRYPHWGGLYTDSQGQRLYVNIGAGEVGMPARIGATPEITLFILTR